MEKRTRANKRAGGRTTPLHAGKIEDYSLIGDCETAALVSREGSIDWMCWPTFSSGSCFAALLGTRDHGFWKIAPKAKLKASRRQYRAGTLVVETSFETAEGEVQVIDFMPPRRRHSDVVRIVKGVRGRVAMKMELAIRFDYGRTVPWVTSKPNDGSDSKAKRGKRESWSELHAIAGMDLIVLRTPAKLKGEDHSTMSEFTVHAGETMPFTLTYGSSLEAVPPAISPERALADTESYWTRWVGRRTYKGSYQEAVGRSLMTLKAMTYRPTGGIVAAVTTSLPEKIGGSRNWDYRYCWLRDTAFTLEVLLRAGYREEALAWRRWLLRAVAGSPGQIQTLYGISGERDMNEWNADWLPGYEHSLPVRIGNQAAGQFQLDVFGEMAAALARMPEAEGDIRVSAGALQVQLVNHLCDVWQKPDQGIWEMRGKARHFVHSKVMAWVAVNSAIRLAEQATGGEARVEERKAHDKDVRRWKKVRAKIHKEVCEKGFNKKLNSFVQSYGSKALDASCLRLVLVGFLPPKDARIRGTVEAIEKRLMKGGLVQRYSTSSTDDGLTGTEGEFLACSFWMVANLWLIGQQEEATKLFERLLALRNDVGLLSEEYDSTAKRMVGNFPQALSHIALVHAALTMSEDWSPDAPQ